jgi:hypothetical protein
MFIWWFFFYLFLLVLSKRKQYYISSDFREANPDENCFGQEVRLERDVLYQHQCYGKDSVVDLMDKEKSIISPSKTKSTTGDHNNRCSPVRIGATLSFTKHSNFLTRLPPTRINNTSFR